MSNLLYLLALIALFLPVAFLFSPAWRFRKIFGKWPAQVSDYEIRNKLNELSYKWREAKKKCDDFARKNECVIFESDPKNILDNDYLQTQRYCAEYAFKKASNIVKKVKRIPKYSGSSPTPRTV